MKQKYRACERKKRKREIDVIVHASGAFAIVTDDYF
jgi:hypothetical protein